jgi:hypothetical protein
VSEDVEKIQCRLKKTVNLAAERAAAARLCPEGPKGEIDAALNAVVRLCEKLPAHGEQAVAMGRGYIDKQLADLDINRSTDLRRRLGALHPGFVQAIARPADREANGREANTTVFSGPGRAGPKPFKPSAKPQSRPNNSQARPSPFKKDIWVVQVSTGRTGLIIERMGNRKGPIGDEWQLLVDVEGRGYDLVPCWEHELRLATEDEQERLRATRQREKDEFDARWAAQREAEAARAAAAEAEAEETARRAAEAARRAEARLVAMRKARGRCELLAIASKPIKDREALHGRAAVGGRKPAYVVFRRMSRGKLKLDNVYFGKAAATRAWNEKPKENYKVLKPELKRFDHLCAEVEVAVREFLANAD